MLERLQAWLHTFCTRPCRDEACQRNGWHDAHLTLIGRVRHVWRFL